MSAVLNDPFEVDVRRIVPRDRHQMIFGVFDGLASGQAMLLINDHDPRPLYYQMLHERTGQFHWKPLQEGPQEWRIEIVKQ